MTNEQLADLLDRAAARIVKTAGSVRKDFDGHLLSAECGKAAHALRTPTTPKGE